MFLNSNQEISTVQELANFINLSPNRINQIAEKFSGGNQQKLMLLRCLTRNFDLIIFDEPTIGVDVATRVAIYSFISELCKNGTGVILISSDLPEILHLSNRVYVFYQGVIQVELQGDEITESNVLSHFFEKQAA